MGIATLLLALLIGLVAGFLVGTSRTRIMVEETTRRLQQEREQERADRDRRMSEVQARADDREHDVRTLTADLATERQRHADLAEKLATQEAELERMHQRMTDQFKLIANELLENKGRQLTDQQQEKLGQVLKPLQERMREFEEQVRKAYDQEGRERFALKAEIMRLVEQNQQLSREADNLTRALKGDTQVQGAWGEMVLERLLENSGLVKGQEYYVQDSTTLADGSRLRPDVVVNLPDDKHLVIDSKVSLVHYERFVAATDEAEKGKLLKAHVESLRAHAKGLGEKDYPKLYGIQSVDFTLLFVPLEPAFLLALRERPEIFQEAYDRQVVMVTHSTLMATLRTIHGIWKHERIARNHLLIAERAGALYEKFVSFTEDLLKMGGELDKAKEHYSSAMKRLSTGQGNLVRQVELLKELGAKTNKGMNPALLQRATENGA